MPCQGALIQSPICVDRDSTVEQALDTMAAAGLRKLPVLDSHGHFVGMFGLCTLLAELLPVSARMQDGLPTLGFIKGASPGVAKRLLKLKKKKIGDVMVRRAELVTVQLDTPIWEAMRVIISQGSPLAVIDENTGNFCGLVSEQSILANLEGVIDEMEKDPERYFGN